MKKKFIFRNVSLSHMENWSVAPSEALFQGWSLMKYGAFIKSFSFRIAVLNIFVKFLKKHHQQSSYSA